MEAAMADIQDGSSDKQSRVSSPIGANELEIASTAFLTDSHRQMIGSYRIIRQIGAGGMGVIYEAEQQQPKRLVALKVIQGTRLLDEQTIKLFEREAQALARLKHPGIAAIYESGRTPQGQHFFAMELVRGETLEAYLERSAESPIMTPALLRERLAIFHKIAEAITYAHQRGVIHRDLKPSNIIIQREFDFGDSDAERVPGIKILDFGLARITESDMAVATTFGTEIGKIQGTLPYMSPEQIRGNPDEIDVRSDVYSLGIILYEMIAGRRPYDVHQMMLHEAARVICEVLPDPLAKSWSGTKRLDRDIETIVGKALEKDAPRRYQSVAALGEDISRFLTGQPILARPPNAVYQLRKMAARHKLGFAFTALVFVLIASFSIGISIQARRIARERDRANREAGRANMEAAAAVQVSDFLTDLFRVSDPSEARGRAITAREVLDKGAARIKMGLTNDPVLQARLLYTMGYVYRNLGELDQAEQLLEQSVSIRQNVLGQDALDTLRAMSRLGDLYDLAGKTDIAEKMLTAVLEKERRILGEDHQNTLKTLANLANIYDSRGRYEKSFPMMQDVLERRRKTLGSDNLDTLSSEYNLAIAYYRKQDFPTAERLLQEVSSSVARSAGSDHPYALLAKNLLAEVYLNLNRLDDSRRIRQEVYETSVRVLGPDHMDTLGTKLGLANTARRQKRFAEAETLFRDTLEAQIRILGPDHADCMATRVSLATMLSDAARFDEAERLWHDTLTRMERTLGKEHPDTAHCLLGLAIIEMHRGHRDAVLRLLRDAVRVNPEQVSRTAANPAFMLLKGNPEFDKLMARAGRNEETLSRSRN
jgi:eukaryotic-like serine/threonine-protein kinase